jgi:PAS domain S-box-containing protein
MNFERGRRVFQLYLKLDRNEWLSRLLTTILVSGAVLEGLFIIVRLLGGERFPDATVVVTTFLLVLHIILLFVLKRGYVHATVFTLILSGWAGATYLAWAADGVRDTTVTVYVLIVLISALIADWRFSLLTAVFSIVAIWGLAFGEMYGLVLPVNDPPIKTAWELTVIFLLLVIVVYLMVSLVGNSTRALQESEQKYRNFVEESIEGVWLLAFDHPISTHLPAEEQVELIYAYGYIAECNNSLAHMYGYASSTELVGARLLDTELGKPIDETNYQATLKLVKEGYRSGNRETRELTRTGDVVYFLNSAVGVIKDDHLVGLWGTQLDITPVKKAEEAMRRSDARTQALLDAIPDMIFEMDREGRILRFVPSTINRPLLPPEEFIGKTIAQVIPSLAEQTAFAIDRALKSGQLTAIEYALQLDGENRTFEARISPAGSDLVLAMVRDVTLRKWAESERESLIDELESKNAELERFTYTVSHDLKSPLITIRGFLGFIREDTEQGNMQRLEKDIQRISDATDKMQSLLGDLLELSRIGRLTNQPETIHMNALVNEVLEFLHGRIHASNITVRVAENLPDVFGDRKRIFEVFQNLIDNATKFMGEQPKPCIEIGQSGRLDGETIFLVRDNGIGIDEIYVEKIFGLFNKLDSQTEGTGIGLTLVKRIIEFHGGRIWVESEPAKGATFFFTLPDQPKPGRLVDESSAADIFPFAIQR